MFGKYTNEVCNTLEYSPQNHTYRAWKQGLDGSIENSPKRPLKRACLTERNLKALEKMKRKRKSAGKLSQVQKSLRSELGSSRSEAKLKPSTTSEASNKTVSSTDSRFLALISRNGIVEQPNSKRPANFDHLQERLNRARESASPT